MFSNVMQTYHFEGCKNNRNILDCLYNLEGMKGDFKSMTEKKFCCYKCFETKPLTEFHKDKSRKNGHREHCKECIAKYTKKYRSKNTDSIREKKRQEYLKDRIKIIERSAKWAKNNHERRKEISLKSATKIYHERYKHDPEYVENKRIKAMEYYEDNKECQMASCNRRAKIRRKTDPEYQAACSARNLLGAVTRYIGKKPPGRTHKILGYSAKKLMRHIESKFLPGMSWKNRGDWHIDHIKPVSAFIAEGTTDPAIINALDNLQPLWAKDNQAKGNDYVAI